MTTMVNLRNYFSPVDADVRLGEGLDGELVYVEHQLGAKTSNTPQCGLFLFCSDQEPVDIADDRFMQEEYAMFESWWQADVPFDAPFETKVQTFRETGVFWLDNDVLSLYVRYYLYYGGDWQKTIENADLRSWFANHDCQKTQHMVEHYLAALRCERTEYKMLRDYVEKISPNLYTEILNYIATHLGEMYHDKLTIVGMPSTDGYMSFLANLVSVSKESYWWQCYDQSYYATSPNREQVEWSGISIEPMIIAMLAALYWREHPDFTRTDAIPKEAVEQTLPLNLREWLWAEYMKLHRGRIFTMLSERDNSVATPTEDEIKAELLKEELEKLYLYPEHLLPFRSRVQVFRKQFLHYLGYVEPETEVEEVQTVQESKPEPMVWDRKRCACLLQGIYEKLMAQEEHPFTGKSQWYYVYRMLCEKLVFKEDQYAPFRLALTDAKIPTDMMPNTTTFSVKKKSISVASAFPHWEAKSGKRTDVLEVGIYHARMAYEVLKEFEK